MSGTSQPEAAPAAVIVIFGAAGDLTLRKLIPALFYLATPPSFFGVIATELGKAGLAEEADELLRRDGFSWKNTQ